MTNEEKINKLLEEEEVLAKNVEVLKPEQIENEISLIDEKEPSKWSFDENALNINDMMRMKIPLREVVEVDGLRLPISWVHLITICNYKIIKGPKITGKTSVKEAINAYTQVMNKSFL